MVEKKNGRFVFKKIVKTCREPDHNWLLFLRAQREQSLFFLWVRTSNHWVGQLHCAQIGYDHDLSPSAPGQDQHRSLPLQKKEGNYFWAVHRMVQRILNPEFPIFTILEKSEWMFRIRDMGLEIICFLYPSWILLDFLHFR